MISQTDARAPTVELPEVFVEEELVFQVAVRSGSDQVTERVTVRVQPVDSTQREGTMQSSRAAELATLDDDQGPRESRGIGRIWAALAALVRTGPPRGSA